jgi:hypothetical protein
MSKPELKDFTCPVCGWVKKAPFTEQDIIEHLKKHPDDKTLRARITKSQLIKLQ